MAGPSWNRGELQERHSVLKAQSPGHELRNSTNTLLKAGEGQEKHLESAYFVHGLLWNLHRHLGWFSLLWWRPLDFGRVEFVLQLHGEGGEMRTLRVWKQRRYWLLEAEWEEAVVHSPPVEMSVVLWQIFPFHCLRLQRKGNTDPFKFFCLYLSIFAIAF